MLGVVGVAGAGGCGSRMETILTRVASAFALFDHTLGVRRGGPRPSREKGGVCTVVERYERVHFSLAESRLLGEQLAAARRAMGVSAGSLACRLGVAAATVCGYEAGRGRLPVRFVFAAARALDVSPYQLLSGRADRVLNPWGPSLVEWRGMWRGADARSAGCEEDGERGVSEPRTSKASLGRAGVRRVELDRRFVRVR